MAKKQNYDASTVMTLDPLEHMRKYPGMYVGSKDIHGLQHCAKEIISNAIDEFLNGSGSEIIVKLNKDGSIYIKDNGRGIPHGEHSPGISTLQACFGIANTGGKFNNATGESGYNTSGGEHGTGGKAVNALSKKMVVTTARDGIKETVEFAKGKFIKHKEVKSNEQGVEVLFYPDSTIFETVEFDSDALEKMLREFSFLCKGLSFNFIDEIKEKNETFCSTSGLYDYFEYLNKDKEQLCEPFYFEKQEGQFQVEVVFGYNKTYTSTTKLYTNNIPQESGTHLTGFRTAFTSYMNNYVRDKGWLKEKEENLTGGDYSEGQILIINFKMIDPVFKGQHKEELTSSEGRTYVQKFTSSGLDEAFAFRDNDVKIFFEKAIAARRAREAAKKAKDAARNVGEKKPTTLNLPTKLVDCWGKDRSKCELLIAEGDSAAGGLIGARDGEYQAVFPIRGKIINLYKNSNEKVFANQEVLNIIKALGLTFDSKTHKLDYDAKKLRYGKIIMCCDADPDGLEIRNLLLTCFWSLCPELVLNGHIYAAIPPLFRITTKKNEYIFLKDGVELEEYKKQHIGEKFLINRNKGLGEQDPEELEECLLNPESRNVAQITIEDRNKTEMLFEILMGEGVGLRREYILKHVGEANE